MRKDEVSMVEDELHVAMGRVAEEDAWLSYIPAQHPDYAATAERKRKFLMDAAASRQRLRQAKLDLMVRQAIQSRGF